jgi:ATP-binding protein involved in chromosome partitioning
MVDPASVQAAVGGVVDPELLRSLDDLGAVRKVRTRRRGAVDIQVALVTPNYPKVAELEQAIVGVVSEVPEVDSVEVEFVVMTDEERADLMQRLRPEPGMTLGKPGSKTRVLAVSSGKGGVGKSSVTVNLAVALVRAGQSVGVIDADVWGFSVPGMLGVQREPVVVESSIIPPVAHGVKVISMDYFVPQDQAVIWRGPMLHKAIEQFLTDVWWDDPDLLLVDMPPGTGDVAISLSQFLPRAQVLVVTTPQPTAQRVAKRAALMARRVNQEVLGVVENMSWFTGDDGKRYPIFGEGGGAELAEDLGVPLLTQIPLLPALRAGADQGAPVVDAAPGSEAEEAFRRLADEVISRKPKIRTHPELIIR